MEQFDIRGRCVPVAAFAAQCVGLIYPTLTRGATCCHRFAVVSPTAKTAKRWKHVATGVSLWLDPTKKEAANAATEAGTYLLRIPARISKYCTFSLIFLS